MSRSPMTQDYGQWQPASPGPFGQPRFHLQWFHRLLEDEPNGPVATWELFWEPGRPQICYYRNPNFQTDLRTAFPSVEFPFACRSTYDPLYNIGDQFFVNIIINLPNFGAANSVSPPSVNGNPGNFPDQPPPPVSRGNQPAVSVPLPPNGNANPNLTIKGVLFDLFLTHDQVQTILATGSVAAQVVDVPEISAVILACISFIVSVDQAGGNQGVDISGVIGSTSILVTPHGTVTIFDVVNLVQGIPQLVGDQHNPALSSTIQQLKSDTSSAGNAIDHGVSEFNNFINQAVSKSGIPVPPLPPIPPIPPIKLPSVPPVNFPF